MKTGEDALEPAVHDALGALGGSVTPAPEKGREDGRTVDPSGRHPVLEVKGRTGSAKIDDVRQLQDWVTRALAEDDSHDRKGLLVLNHFYDTPPDDRGEPFPDPCIRFASRFSLAALMTTTQLSQAVADHQAGVLTAEAFWDAVDAAQPICDLPSV